MKQQIKIVFGVAALLVTVLATGTVWARQTSTNSQVRGSRSAALSPTLIDRVLVVENADSPVSIRIARHYLKQRGVKKIVQVHCQDSALDTGKETMAFADFKEKIEAPLKEFLAQDPTIDFIVLTKGIPIRLTDAPVGVSGKQPSLDSYLAALDYFDRPDAIPIQLNDSGFTGKCFANRFWNSNERFSHAKFGGYLVTRLDGFTAEQAMRLTNSAIKAEKISPQGPILLDIVASHGLTNLEAVPLSPLKDGSLDLHLVNEMAYNEWDTDLTVAESFYAASRFVGWEDIVIGDPLCAPYAPQR